MKTIDYNGRKHNVFTLTTEFGQKEVICTEERYQNCNNLAVELLVVENGKAEEPYARLTTNICPLEDGYACIDTNNNSWARQFIKQNKLGKSTGNSISSGYCIYPLYKMDTTKFYEN